MPNRLEECAFCVPGAFDGRLINETGLMRSFLSNPKLTMAHALVIPRRHVVPPEALTPDEMVATETEAERIRLAMLGLFATSVVTLQKTSPDVPEGHNGSKVDHWHRHVIGVTADSEMYERGVLWTPDMWSELTPNEASVALRALRPM